MTCKAAKDIVTSYISQVKLSNYQDAFDIALKSLEFTSTIKAMANTSEVTSNDIKTLYKSIFKE